MPDDHEKIRRDWRIPDPLWARIEPLLPARKPQPPGCIGPVLMIAKPWMPSFSCSARAASGKP